MIAASTYRMYFSSAKVVIIFETTNFFRGFFNMTQKKQRETSIKYRLSYV